jgi:hypothetical protein
MVTTRRAFLSRTGLLAAGFGTSLTDRLRLAFDPRIFDSQNDEPDELTFGELEPLAALIQETPPAELLAILIERLKPGKLELGTLVAGLALANSRTFGGEDYVGYHCMMALAPALFMAQQLREAREKPLPVLKVAYRTASRIQEVGGRRREVLHAPPASPLEGREADLRRLRSAVIARDADAAERAFAALSRAGKQEAYDALQEIVQEDVDVHRVVLAWRAWETLPVAGDEHALTLMRQSVRFCVHEEDERVRRGSPEPRLRTLLPELLEERQLATKPAGTRRASDEELEELGRVVFRSEREDAARAMAAALAGDLAHEDAGAALSLAANALLLHDPGRGSDSPGRPKGSVHGASTGVHASDAARAWRNIAGVTNRRNAAASLIAGAFHTAGQSEHVGKQPFPYRDVMDRFEGDGPDELLRRTAEAIDEGNQPCAAAAAARYAEAGQPEEPMLALLLGYAVSEDGALHAEKYYRTICEELADARPAHRARHLIALARVTASEHGWEAPGLAEAKQRLGG